MATGAGPCLSPERVAWTAASAARLAIVSVASVLSQEVAIEQLRTELAEIRAQLERKPCHLGHLLDDCGVKNREKHRVPM